MDWMTLPMATVFASALVAIGAIIGILIRGSFDLHMAKRQLTAHLADTRKQLDFQRDLAVKQIETQRQLARDQQAEDRTQRLLAERRKRYKALIECAIALPEDLVILQTTAASDLSAGMHARFNQRVAEYRRHAQTLQLIAPTKVLSWAVRVMELCTIDPGRFGSSTRAAELSNAVHELRKVCREDLQHPA